MSAREGSERILVANQVLDAVAHEFHGTLGHTMELAELRSLGTEGVARALAEWDGRGVFAHFVVQRARWSVIDGLRRKARQEGRTELRDELAMTASAARAAETANLDAPPDAPVFRDMLRSAADGFDLEMEAAAAAGEGAEEVERDVERMTVRRAVDRLPEPGRTVIERHYYLGETFDELAHQMGMSKSTVFDAHNRALARLREMLNPQPAEEGAGAGTQAALAGGR